MNSLLTLAKDLEQKSSAAAEYRRNAEKPPIQRARICQAEPQAKAGRESRRHPRPREQEYERGHAQSGHTGVMRMVGRTWLTITMVSGLSPA